MPRILLIHTGGTIGMVEGPLGLAPRRGALAELISKFPRLAEPSRSDAALTRFSTPSFADGERIEYELLELDELLDSANLDLSHWVAFARLIAARYDEFDAFVLLHGTDTMAYTAAALSFMFEGLAKPVVLTGSQIPLARLRTDAQDNLLGALIVAARHPLPEVALYFHHRLLRGNRSTKIDARSLEAFASPRMQPLIEVGTEIRVRRELVLPPPTTAFSLDDSLCTNVAALRVYPGITAEILANFLRPPLRGLVLETYGTGNFPAVRPDLLEVLAEASERGVLIVNVSQCLRGGVGGDYEAGRALTDLGVVSGADLTPEAALTKLASLLGRELTLEQMRERARTPLRGEMSPQRAPTSSDAEVQHELD